MTRILCALAVICLGGLATGVSPALGAFPGDNGKIASTATATAATSTSGR
jgi:hypothetical protein